MLKSRSSSIVSKDAFNVNNGPRRINSTVSWSPDQTLGWADVNTDEGLEERVNRYLSYLCPSERQLKFVKEKIQDEMTRTVADAVAGTITLDDAYVQVFDREYPENGVSYGVELGVSDIVAVRLEKKGKEINIIEERTPLKSTEVDLTKPSVTAYQFFEVVAETVKRVWKISDSNLEIAFVSAFEVSIWSDTSMHLTKWSFGVATGRSTDDQMEGGDMAAMLQFAFQRKKMPFKVASCLGSQSASAVLGLTQIDEKKVDGRFRFVAHLGDGFSLSLCSQKVEHLQVRGEVVDLLSSDQTVTLPTSDIDIEIDWADQAVNGRRLEKMIAGCYLGEIARRAIVKVYEQEAPLLSWSRGSLPLYVCIRIIEDESEEFSVCKEIMKVLWDWEIDCDDARRVTKICRAVLVRASALTAACIVAGVQSYNGLQPALGNTVVGVRGALFSKSNFYRDMVRKNIIFILGDLLARLIVLVPLEGSGATGGAMYQLSYKKAD